MPSGAFHSFYWQTAAVVIPPDTPGGSGSGGYPSWQANVVIFSALLALILQRF